MLQFLCKTHWDTVSKMALKLILLALFHLGIFTILLILTVFAIRFSVANFFLDDTLSVRTPEMDVECIISKLLDSKETIF